MKILISGGTGFIGKHLIKRLANDGHEIILIVRPNSSLDNLNPKIKTFVFENNIEDLIVFMKKQKISGVVHLATLYLSSHKPSEIRGLIDSNILFSTSLLEAAVQSNTRWFINTGTFWQHFKNKDYSPGNLYAATKQAFEDIAKYYYETNLIDFVTLKLNDTFGPDDTRPKIFNHWVRTSQTGEKLKMSPGKQIMSITHIDNVIDGFCQMINLLENDREGKFRGKVFAINSKEKITLKELALLFQKITGKKLDIAWGALPYREREVMKPWNKGKNIPGWKQRVSLIEGIKRMYE